jgi:hypothetical protein
MAINEQIPLSAGPAGAARIDQSIPMNVDSRLPLSIKPFQPIDTMAAAGDAYKLADTIESFKSDQSDRIEKQQLQEEKKRDKMILQQYQQSGGDLYTAGGLELAAKELGTRLSPDSLEGLSKRIDAKKTQEVKLQTSLAALDDTALDVVAKQKETASKMMNGALSAYDYALSQTKDPEKAKQAYVATKQALIQAAANEKSPITGRPAYPPEQLKQFETLEPEQLRSIVNDTKWHMDKVREEQVNRLHEAQTKSAEATAGYKEKETEAVDTKLAQAQQKIDQSQQKIDNALKKGNNFTPEQVSSIAKLVAEGKQPVPTGRAAMTPMGAAIIAEAAKINPDLDAKVYGTMAKAEKDFATGKQGNAVRSFNVAVDHLSTLSDLAVSLKNGDIKAVNKFGNAYAEQTGDPAPTNFDAAKQLVSDEIVKAVIGGAGALGDREKADKALDRANSPEALQGVIDTYKKLMLGQLKGLGHQYEISTNKKDFSKKFLFDSTKKDLGYKDESSNGSSGFPTVSKAQQGEMDQGRTEILTQELDSAQARRDEAQNPDAKRRAEQDIAAIERELAGTTGKKSGTKKSSPLKNAKGWALHQDAKGNRAYVGPNGEIEEVK